MGSIPWSSLVAGLPYPRTARTTVSRAGRLSSLASFVGVTYLLGSGNLQVLSHCNVTIPHLVWSGFTGTAYPLSVTELSLLFPIAATLPGSPCLVQ